MFPTGTLSFQESQQIWPCDDMPVSIDTIKHLIGKLGEMYSFKNKSNNHENSKSSETTVNEVIVSINNKQELFS